MRLSGLHLGYYTCCKLFANRFTAIKCVWAYRVDGGTCSGLAVAVLAVTSALWFTLTRLPETILIQRVRH